MLTQTELKLLADISGCGVFMMCGDGSCQAFPDPEACPYFRDPDYAGHLRILAERHADLYNGAGLFIEEEVIYCGIWSDPKEGAVYIAGPFRDRELGEHLLAKYRHRHHVTKDLQPSLASVSRVQEILALLADLGCHPIEDYSLIGMIGEDDALPLESRPMQGKQTEYLTLTLIVLISRAAIEGGLNPEYAHQIADLFSQRLSVCRTNAGRNSIGIQAFHDFTQAVSRAQGGRHSPLVESCKDYIEKNLRSSFQIGDIAESLHVSRTYLSSLFHREEGMTIQQYTAKRRCVHAANMLRYSDYEIAVIAQYFCFSSQSKFTVHFREIYKVTPAQYRRQNKYIYTRRTNENKE